MGKVYTSLVPQYGEFGEDTGYWMLHHDSGIYPNLDLGWGPNWVLEIKQVEDFYEDEPEGHTTDLGTLDCGGMCEDEWRELLAQKLADDERAWCLI